MLLIELPQPGANPSALVTICLTCKVGIDSPSNAPMWAALVGHKSARPGYSMFVLACTRYSRFVLSVIWAYSHARSKNSVSRDFPRISSVLVVIMHKTPATDASTPGPPPKKLITPRPPPDKLWLQLVNSHTRKLPLRVSDRWTSSTPMFS